MLQVHIVFAELKPTLLVVVSSPMAVAQIAMSASPTVNPAVALILQQQKQALAAQIAQQQLQVSVTF